MGLDLDPVSLTRTLLRFDTINPPGHERACAHHVGRMLEGAGCRVDYHEFADRRTSLVARLPGGTRTPICFTGHLDTVPLGLAEWSRDPLSGEVDGDRLYGRGSSDMKAGVAAMLIMAIRLARRDPSASVSLVLTAGEETCCQGAQSLAASPGVLGAAGALVVGEPTANYPWIGHKGVARFEIKTRGVTAHASMPEEGDNAIHKAADVVQRLRTFDFGVPAHPVLGAPTLNIGTIAGGLNINSVPDEVTLGVDIRVIPGQDAGAIGRALQARLGPDVAVRGLETAQSIETEPSEAWVQQVYDIVQPVLGERPVPAGAPYFTDGSVLRPAFGHPPTVVLGPGEPTLAHKTDEFCRVSRILEAVEIYTQIAQRWGA